ncbi:MAG: hypothetical protein ACRDUW_26965 [Pseudonocardiaceae bacterium]
MHFRLGQATPPTDTSGGTATAPTSAGGWLQNLITGFAQVKLAQQQANAANQINAINIQRAQQGLPPISVDLTSTAPGVAVGLSPATQSLVQLAIIGGLGLLAINLVMKSFR